MNKINKITGILAVLFVIGCASVFGEVVTVTESDLVVSEDFAVSYEVQPTDKILTFLEDYEIMTGEKTAKKISMKIDALRSIDFDDDDNLDSVKDYLNYLVNSALFSAQQEGYDAVYMEIGNTRWIMYPNIDD